MSTTKQTRIILKPLGFLIFATVPTLAVVAGFGLQRMRKSDAATASPSVAPTAAAQPIAQITLNASSPVRNASFEEREGTQKPAEWEISLAGNNADQVSYIETQNGAHGGGYHLTHYGGADYDVRTTQLLSGLKNGTYTLHAWARKMAGRNDSYLVAKDFADGVPKKMTSIPVSEAAYVPVEVKDIEVRNGQCVIGIYSKAAGGAWTYVDDVEFIPQNTAL